MIVVVSGLAEAAAATAISAIVLTSLTAALGATAVTSLTAWRHVHAMAEQRHIEHLVETALARAEAAGGRLTTCEETGLTVEADLDGNGTVDTTSAEQTAFVVQTRSDGSKALVQRLGRQSMTITELVGPDDRVRCMSAAGGTTADPQLVRLIEVPIAAGSLRAVWFRYGD